MSLELPLVRLTEILGPGEPTGQAPPQPHAELPMELQRTWETIGLRSWLDGFLWLTDPRAFSAVLEVWGLDPQYGHTVARTGLGDLIIWQYDTVYLLNSRMNAILPVESDLMFFLDAYLTDNQYREKILSQPLFQQVRSLNPPLHHGSCYGFVPLPQLGGSGEPTTMQSVDIISYLTLIGQLRG